MKLSYGVVIGSLIVISLVGSGISQQDLESVFQNAESDIIKLRDSYEAAFKNRCNNINGACSNFSCSTNKLQTKCNSDFLTYKCSCFSPGGNNLSLGEYSVQLANSYRPYVDYNDQRVQEVVRAGQSMLPVLQEIGGRQKGYKWMYFGSSNGVFLNWPGFNDCYTYDNR